MASYTLQLIHRQLLAQQTLLLRFNKPTNFSFIPGQFGSFSFSVLPATIPISDSIRRFSFASTPAQPHLDIITQIQTSAYKAHLNELVIGTGIKLFGPRGDFILLPEWQKDIVFIAGGVGIAPFYSMIQHELTACPGRKMHLIYINRNDQSAALLPELWAMADKFPQFQFTSLMIEPSADKRCHIGFPSVELLKSLIPNLINTQFYLCGSARMVDSSKSILASLGVPDTHIHTEDFPGY